MKGVVCQGKGAADLNMEGGKTTSTWERGKAGCAGAGQGWGCCCVGVGTVNGLDIGEEAWSGSGLVAQGGLRQCSGDDARPMVGGPRGCKFT